METLKIIKLLKVGAEANLYLGEFMGYKVIVKQRSRKEYRDPELDQEIRKKRTITEARIINQVRKLGIKAPAILLVNPKTSTIILEYVEGTLLKEYLTKTPSSKNIPQILGKVGEYIGILHSNRIIHGDLTTSNIILYEDKTPVLIDFGLSYWSDDIEDHGTDLHLMLRSLESTHPLQAKEYFNYIVEGYKKIRGEETTKQVIDKIREIRLRGRYIEERRLRKR